MMRSGSSVGKKLRPSSKSQAEKELYLIFEDRKGVEKRAYEAQIQVLYAQIGEVTAKLNWLKKKSGIDV